MVVMLSITPCRQTISDRFPVASFVVNVPPQRIFEIACATDRQLFRSDRRGHRTPQNFYSSRSGGLLRAPAGQATYLLPSDQLRRFAGQRRLYYTVGTYGDAAGGSPEFTAAPGDPATPWLSLSPDFTGRTLDRSRLKGERAEARYGANPPALVWGGDAFEPPAAPAPAQRRPTYDDGYSPDLWRGRDPADPADPSDPPDPEPNGGYAGEPAGFEDAPALRAREQARAYGRRSSGGARSRAASAPVEPPGLAEPPASPPVSRAAAMAEPPGVEDPPHPPAYGTSGAAEPSEPPGLADPVDALKSRLSSQPDFVGTEGTAFAPPGVDDHYDDGDDGEGELSATGQQTTLTIADKFRLAQSAARFESGEERYSAVNADGEFNDPAHEAYQRKHYGLHWGLVQLNQRSGALGRCLVACMRRDPVRFREAFGPAQDELIRVTTSATEEERLKPVASALLWEEPWISRFREAGRIPEFQAAQNEIAIEGYFDPNLRFAAALGFDSDRSLAMLYDRCIGLGNAGGRRFVAKAVTPARDDASLQRALKALGHDSVQALQRSADLRESAELGPKGHAAMIAGLRGLGISSPVPVPSLEEMLDALVTAASGERFEDRLRQIRTAPELSDARRLVT